jgi:orotate phosphoribosyltransferase-like protein
MAIKLTPLAKRLIAPVIDNHNAGLSLAESARQLQVSRNTVEKIIRHLPDYIRLEGEENDRLARERELQAA